MNRYLKSVVESLSSISADEVVGGLLVGLTLSLAASGLWMLARKRMSDPFPVLCGLTLLVSALSMGFGLGYSRYKLDRMGSPSPVVHLPAGAHGQPSWIGRRLLREADANRDGRLTPQEAARFVEEVDRAGKGWADISDIDRSGREWAGARRIPGVDSDKTIHLRQLDEF